MIALLATVTATPWAGLSAYDNALAALLAVVLLAIVLTF